jgi:uncharacterized protein with PIN domain
MAFKLVEQHSTQEWQWVILRTKRKPFVWKTIARCLKCNSFWRSSEFDNKQHILLRIISDVKSRPYCSHCQQQLKDNPIIID